MSREIYNSDLGGGKLGTVLIQKSEPEDPVDKLCPQSPPYPKDQIKSTHVRGEYAKTARYMDTFGLGFIFRLLGP